MRLAILGLVLATGIHTGCEVAGLSESYEPDRIELRTDRATYAPGEELTASYVNRHFGMDAWTMGAPDRPFCKGIEVQRLDGAEWIHHNIHCSMLADLPLLRIPPTGSVSKVTVLDEAHFQPGERYRLRSVVGPERRPESFDFIVSESFTVSDG